MTTKNIIPDETLNLVQETLRNASQQIEYLHEKFQETGSGNGVRGQIANTLAKLDAAITSIQNDGMHGSIFAKVWGDAGGGDAGRAALAHYAYELGHQKAQDDAGKVCFTDQWNCKHTLTVDAAAKELKAFYDAWPGGLEEIESAIKTASKLAASGAQSPQGAKPE